MTIQPITFKQFFPQLLERFSLTETEVLLAACEQITVGADTTCYRCGDRNDTLHLFFQGQAIVSLDIDSTEIPLGKLGPGQFIGVISVIDPGPALINLRIVEPSVLLALDYAGLQRLRSVDATIYSNLLRVLSEDLTTWLRAYEEYLTQRIEPDSIDEFISLGRQLLGIGESQS